jgi:membrane protein implicated in regulation of membrane protease activity
LAGANLAAGGLFLTLYLKRRQSAQYLPFSLLCFAIAAYDFFCAGLYSARSLEQGIFWQRLQVFSFGPINVLILWFVGLTAEKLLDRVLRLFVGAICAFAFAVLLFDRPGLTLSAATPSTKTILWAGRPFITYYESEYGILLVAASAIFYAGFAYAGYQLYRAQRRTRSRYQLAILAGLGVYCAGLLIDSLVEARLLNMVYTSEYAYLVLVSIMAVALLRRFADLQREIETLNAGLEQRVQRAQDEIEVLHDLIPICASCKRVRRDGGYWQQVEEYFAEHHDATFSHGVCPDCIEKLYPDVLARRAARAGGPTAG